MKKMNKIITTMLIGGIIAGNVTNVYATTWQNCVNKSTVINDAKKTITTTSSSSGENKNGIRSSVHQAKIKAYHTYNSSQAEYFQGAMKVYGVRSAVTKTNSYMRNVRQVYFNL